MTNSNTKKDDNQISFRVILAVVLCYCTSNAIKLKKKSRALRSIKRKIPNCAIEFYLKCTPPYIISKKLLGDDANKDSQFYKHTISPSHSMNKPQVSEKSKANCERAFSCSIQSYFIRTTKS